MKANPSPMPTWLHELITATAAHRERSSNGTSRSGSDLLLRRASQYVAKADSASQPAPGAPGGTGGRNYAAFNLAGHLASFTDTLGNRLAQQEVYSLLSPWNLRNTPPLSDDELRLAVYSGMTNGTPRQDKVINEADDILSQLKFGRKQHEQPPHKPVQFYSFSDLAAAYPKLSPPVVDGLFRLGETANVIADPKIGKSWLGYGLGLSITQGQDWLGFPSRAGRVGLIDNELHPQTLAVRIPKVATAMGLFLDDWRDKFDILPLRGNLCSLNQLLVALEGIDKGKYQLLILDAKYRFPTGESENDNSAEALFYNTVDQLAEQTGAAVVLIHHASKGDQSDKKITDVGAGAGSQSRAADAHIILRPHEDEGVVVMDAAVRSFPPVDPVALRWEFPLWVPTDADCSQLRTNKNSRERKQEAEDKKGFDAILKVLLAGPATTREVRRQTRFGKDKANRLLDRLESDGHITRSKITVRGNACDQFATVEESV